MVALFAIGECSAQGFGGLQNTTSRPFVTGFTPVIGPGGGVGGVLVDAKGVVHSAKNASQLRDRWAMPNPDVDEDVRKETRMRMISLSRLNDQLREHVKNNNPVAEELFVLAGLRRVEYVFVYPDEKDIVIAGPAGDWRTNHLCETVSVKTGEAVVRLDDLMDALRSTVTQRQQAISCSIEPTQEGLERYAKIKARLPRSKKAAVVAMERALGMQQVLLTGVPRDGHFASVMVAADYLMKRYAMGFESAPVAEMPDYMTMLRSVPDGTRLTSPRWWMAANYEPLQRAPDGLAWRIRGVGIQTRTEDSLLDERGQRQSIVQPNALAEKWATTMTDNYDLLSAQRGIFGQLRNCFDLAVVGALVSENALLEKADCRLDVLLDPSQLGGPVFPVPKSIPSKATLVRGKSGWLVSISGGVDIDAWSIVASTEEKPNLKPREYARRDRWWW